MALCKKWWILCAVSLCCVARFGSCRRGRQDRAQPELFIFNELCALKDDPGPCKAIKQRYFFNVDTGGCELFDYGGCGGNENNFHTLEACEEMCLVSDDKDPCPLREAPGPCRGMVKRYFFDSESQQCRHFFYGGCFGNANNFRSMAECEAKCPNPTKTTKAPEVQTQTSVVVQTTVMTGEMTVKESQLQMNDTNHEDKDSKHPKHCLNAVERGTCDGAEKRFAFNQNTNRCHSFGYSGCGGNNNNFMSRKECIHKCIRRRKASTGTGMIRIRKKNLDIINRLA